MPINRLRRPLACELGLHGHLPLAASAGEGRHPKEFPPISISLWERTQLQVGVVSAQFGDIKVVFSSRISMDCIAKTWDFLGTEKTSVDFFFRTITT
ncbi:hypothetical protein CEXT_230411 [Caerostris extrusa]|uniref:Uncharacterized protein n=1 Tax=Caerostris extrusa TaxID=172846 RepID=A0AAV4U9N6_CAEEX|nr:hypothetical protein CEXT_230411 [Caerostris extrusa]